MRCDEFYEKWRRCGNFCEKHPDTAAEIEALLDFIDEIKERDNLSEGAKAAFAETSARAVRPLIREKDTEIRDKAIESVGKAVESGKNPVTGRFSSKPPTERDITSVIETIREDTQPKSDQTNTGGSGVVNMITANRYK